MWHTVGMARGPAPQEGERRTHTMKARVTEALATEVNDVKRAGEGDSEFVREALRNEVNRRWEQRGSRS